MMGPKNYCKQKKIPFLSTRKMSARRPTKKKKRRSNKKIKKGKPSFRKYESQKEVESLLLPVPSDVQDWISGKTVSLMKSKKVADMKKFVKMKGRKATQWLRKALRASYLSPEIKRMCKELLGVRYFTENLTPMELFNDLQNDCKTAALDIGFRNSWWTSCSLRKKCRR